MAKKSKTAIDIAHLAKQAASELLEAMPLLMAAEPAIRNIRIFQALERGQTSAAKLKAAFLEDPSFGYLRGGWIQGGNFGMSLQGHALPYILINSALNAESVGPIITKARAFSKSTACKIEKFTPLAGVTVTKTVKLDKNIDLIPWADVPDSSQKQLFGPVSSGGRFALMRSGFYQERAIANSAIRIRSPKRQVLFSSHEEAKPVAKASSDENTARTELIRDVVRCMTVSTMNVVAVMGNWSRFDQEIVNNISSSGYSYDGTLLEKAVQKASSRPVALDEESLPGLFRCFKKLKSSEKDVLRIAIDRLYQALLRQNSVDQAIDLGIALEVMLLHGIGEADRGEMRYRTSIRGAAFLGENKVERAKIFKRLRDTYDLRSTAVHSGVIKSKKGKKSPEKILEEAIHDTADIARKLIDRGSFPDWDAEYVIGGN